MPAAKSFFSKSQSAGSKKKVVTKSCDAKALLRNFFLDLLRRKAAGVSLVTSLKNVFLFCLGMGRHTRAHLCKIPRTRELQQGRNKPSTRTNGHRLSRFLGLMCRIYFLLIGPSAARSSPLPPWVQGAPADSLWDAPRLRPCFRRRLVITLFWGGVFSRVA